MIKQGQFGLIRTDFDRKEFPEGAVVLIMSHNTPEKQYQVTSLLDSKPTQKNPYILENEETGFKITKEQFDTGEFVDYNLVEPFTFEKPSLLWRFVSNPVTVAAVTVLSFCLGNLVTLEFLK